MDGVKRDILYPSLYWCLPSILMRRSTPSQKELVSIPVAKSIILFSPTVVVEDGRRIVMLHHGVG